MLNKSISSFIPTFFILFPKKSISTNGSSAIVVETADAQYQTSISKSVTTASAPVSPTTTATSLVSSPSKRGVAYNDASLVSAFSKYPEVSWAYNWADATLDIPSRIEYVPMLWGLRDDQNWESNAEKAILSGTTHLLAFNEPDIDSQANLTVAAAVAGYLNHMQPFAGKVKLGSPAVTNGGGHMGLGWLKDFLSRCSSCTIDFAVIHWYNGGNVSAFKDYVVQAHEDGGYRPIWITEFRGPGSAEEEILFLEEVLPWLDSQDYVHRYAYFMASEGSLISGRVLSRIGETFASFV
ncbi:glycosyl hydrolase catalytic core-domain-containing protein [Tricladium varicosporioides]|nr:glycosyl hydrolase catalytic core-domain-containing protein [Hymenoscyphus varicosporioides]